MAKSAMKKKDESQTALATVSDEQAALAAVLGDIEFATDGLDEVSSEDLRVPVLTWNLKGRRKDGSGVHRVDEFYDTLNEKTFAEIRVAFLHLHKSNSFTKFDNDKNENVLVCSSHDRKVGTLRVLHNGQPEGTERKCDGCPDAQWVKAEGKNIRNCSSVYGVYGVLLDGNDQPTDGFLMRFKKTSLPAFKTHLQKHHIGKRVVNGKRADVPLFAFAVSMRLEVSDNGNFAVPVIERGDLLPRAVIEGLAEQAKFLREASVEQSRSAELAEQRVGAVGDAPTGDGFKASDFND